MSPVSPSGPFNFQDVLKIHACYTHRDADAALDAFEAAPYRRVGVHGYLVSLRIARFVPEIEGITTRRESCSTGADGEDFVPGLVDPPAAAPT